MDKTDIDGIATLMGNGFTLQDAMDVLQDEKSKEVFQSIQEHLQRGESLGDFFYKYLPKQHAAYFSGFINFMPFAESLTLVIDILEKEKKNREQLIKGILYPLLLMVGMSAGVFVFNLVVLPKMLALMEGFHMETAGYMKVQKMLQILTTAVCLLVFLCAMVAAYFLQKDKIRDTYRMIAKKMPGSLLVQIASRDFVRFFLECIVRESSTYNALQALKTIEQKPLVGLIAGELDHSLMAGESFSQAVHSRYVEEKLEKFFRIAVLSSDCAKMLQSYLNMCDARLSHQIKRFSTTVQLCSYLIIGFVLIMVYRILMMPMGMLQQM